MAAADLHTDGLVYVSMAQLRRLELPARQLSFSGRQAHSSLLAGQHQSRLRGRGLNFEELRRYQAAQQQQSEQALQDLTQLSEDLGLAF